MADNTVLDPGAGGDTVATDDIGGTKHQRVKVQHGADGSATDVSAASPLPVDDADTQTKLDTLIAAQDGVEALLTSIKTAVEIIDNSIAGAETQVDVVSAPAIALDAGTLAALETIGLDATTLAALETIELGATTLAALESITIGTALPAGSANIGQVDPRGNVAHDAADSGNPVKTGGRARTALPAAVAQDDRSDTITDKHGRAMVANAPIDQRTSGKATYSNTTAADLIAAPGASVALVVTSVLVVNGHATVDTKVEVRDGTTVKIQGYAGADGGGFQMHDPDGLFVATANTAVTGRNVTTGADVDVFVSGFKVPA